MSATAVETKSPRAPKEEKKGNGIRVIGAGLGRTGTVSLKTALAELGLKPYHMHDVWDRPEHLELWTKYMHAWREERDEERKGEGDKVARKVAAADAVIDAMVRDGYTATTDYPACLLYERLMERFPNALVLLGVRSSGKAWAKSVMNTIGIAAPTISGAPWRYVPFMHKFMTLASWIFEATDDSIKIDRDDGRILNSHEELAHVHDEWARRVQARVPADRLLVHQAAEGWEPICKALNINDVPLVKYPYLNESKEIASRFERMQWITALWWPAVTAIAMTTAGLVLRSQWTIREEEDGERTAGVQN